MPPPVFIGPSMPPFDDREPRRAPRFFIDSDSDAGYSSAASTGTNASSSLTSVSTSSWVSGRSRHSVQVIEEGDMAILPIDMTEDDLEELEVVSSLRGSSSVLGTDYVILHPPLDLD